MVKFTAFEVPPPGAGLVTVTGTVAAEAPAAAGIAAVNCVEFTKVVASAVPPKLTVEPATKFVPVTVIVTAEPATEPPGEIMFIAGVGLRVGFGLDPLEVVDPQP
jgi:hypothetical protein